MRHWFTTLVRRATAALLVALLAGLLLPNVASANDYYAVTFVENDNGSDETVTQMVSSNPEALTSFSQLPLAFTNAGHTFLDWNTSPDGSGIEYSDEANYAFTADLTLYAQWSASFTSVTFAENDSSSDNTAADQTDNLATLLTSFLALAPAFSNPGHTFNGWNTTAVGNGTAYSDGETYSFASDMTLYAQWAVAQGTLSFAANGGSGTTSPVVAAIGSSVTLSGAGSLALANHTFSGWNTSADGNGTAYAIGSSFTMSSSPTLYAQWTVNNGTLQFITNGSAGLVNSIIAPIGSLVVVPGVGSMSFADHTFNDWNSTSDGTGTSYAVNTQFQMASTCVLYAQWFSTPPTTSGTPTPPTTSGTLTSFEVSFGSGEANLPSSVSVQSGASLLLPTPGGLAKPGYTFDGWYSAPTGGNLVGAAGSVFVPSSALILYDQWTPNPMVTVLFSSNRGSGTVAALSGLEGAAVTLPSSSTLAYLGYTFAGWGTSANASGTSFANGTSMVLSRSMTLYAQWLPLGSSALPALLIGAVGSFEDDSTVLSPALKNQVRRIAIEMKSKRYVAVSLYGYAADGGSASSNLNLSSKRSLVVAIYLKSQLALEHASAVTMSSAGEGELKGSTTALFRRVEIFVK